MREVFRPNFFANTPDILHAFLQEGGPPAFAIRLVLAATLSPSYGIYSGFEYFESTPVREGSEEYLNSEKYEIRKRDLEGPLMPLVARLNAARRQNPPLQQLDVRFLETENDELIAYAKGSGPGAVLVVVNLDPHNAQEGVCTVPWEVAGHGAFTVRDLLTDATFAWQSGRNYVRLEPALPAHVLRVGP
jgi:starch synthase (maltosyl-transferring)